MFFFVLPLFRIYLHIYRKSREPLHLETYHHHHHHLFIQGELTGTGHFCSNALIEAT